MIGILGADSFLGWHLRVFLLRQKNAPQVAILQGAETPASVALCEVILDLSAMAGVHERGRYTAARQNMLSGRSVGAKQRIVVVLPGAAGVALPVEQRTAGEEILGQWAGVSGVSMSTLELPSIFGEYERAGENAPVAIWCNQLARGEEPALAAASHVELIHAQDAAAHLYGILKHPQSTQATIPGVSLPAADVLAILQRYNEKYEQTFFEQSGSDFERALHNTFRSHLMMAGTFYPREFELKADERGHLFEVLKHKGQGQFFISTTKPGVTRGNHYHTRKLERFVVLAGCAEITIRRLLSDEVLRFNVDGGTPSYVDMPTLATHNITNVGTTDLITCFWTDELFDHNDTDTYAETV